MRSANSAKTCSGSMFRVKPSFLNTPAILHRKDVQEDCGVKSVAYSGPEHTEELFRHDVQENCQLLEHNTRPLEGGGVCSGRAPRQKRSFFVALERHYSAARAERRRPNALRDLGCLTIPFARSRQRNAGRAPLDFRHASTLPLWVSFFFHAPKAPVAASHPFSDLCARRAAGPLPIPSSGPASPRRRLGLETRRRR